MIFDRLVSMARLAGLIRRTLRHKPGDPRTVGDLIEARAAAHPERPFLLFEDCRIAYGDFNAAANRVAHWARQRGLRRGDRVALLMQNRPEYLFTWAGLAKLGVVTALINTSLRGESLRFALRAAETSWLIAGAECQDALTTVTGLDELFGHLVVWAERESDLAAAAPAAESLAPTLAAMPTDNPDRSVRDGMTAGDDLFFIYTSGTTGHPKPARFSHMRFLAIGDIMSSLCRYGPEDVIYAVLPLYHGAGGAVIPASALTVGAAVALRRKFSASRFWDDCRRYGVSGFQYVGEICQFLLNQPPRSDDRQHRVRVMSGTGLHADLWTRFCERFGVARVIESYGSTEGNTSLINLDNKVGSVGRIPFKKLHNGRLIRYDVEHDTHPRTPAGFCIECRPGEVGEFIGQIRHTGDSGAQKFEGYTSREDTERKILRNVFQAGDAWFRTGDLLREDANGYFYFVDRIGDTYRWKSENVSTQEVAAVLSAFPAVEIANVYGVAVPGAEGRAGMAALVLRPGMDFDGAAFFAFTDAHLPGYAAPLFVRIQQEADFTGSYKLRKVDLQREGADPALVKDPLYVRDEAARRYAPLTAGERGGAHSRTTV